MTAHVPPATARHEPGGSTLAPVRPAFRALARSIVPETESMGPDDWAALEVIVEDALAQRPPAMRRQLKIFIRLLSFLPVLRFGRTFRGLDADRRYRFLHGVETSRVFLFRRGFWGLRTLVYMGYYGREEAYRKVGYDARLRGWLEHPQATEAAREATRQHAPGASDAGPDPAAAPPPDADPGSAPADAPGGAADAPGGDR